MLALSKQSTSIRRQIYDEVAYFRVTRQAGCIYAHCMGAGKGLQIYYCRLD